MLLSHLNRYTVFRYVFDTLVKENKAIVIVDNRDYR